MFEITGDSSVCVCKEGSTRVRSKGPSFWKIKAARGAMMMMSITDAVKIIWPNFFCCMVMGGEDIRIAMNCCANSRQGELQISTLTAGVEANCSGRLPKTAWKRAFDTQDKPQKKRSLLVSSVPSTAHRATSTRTWVRFRFWPETC